VYEGSREKLKILVREKFAENSVRNEYALGENNLRIKPGIGVTWRQRKPKKLMKRYRGHFIEWARDSFLRGIFVVIK
jgi:hypothetical protein